MRGGAPDLLMPPRTSHQSHGEPETLRRGHSRANWNPGGLDGLAAHIAPPEGDINRKPSKAGEGGGRAAAAMRHLTWDKSIFLE